MPPFTVHIKSLQITFGAMAEAESIAQEQEQEFIFNQLLEIAAMRDYGDEDGRRQMQTFLSIFL